MGGVLCRSRKESSANGHPGDGLSAAQDLQRSRLRSGKSSWVEVDGVLRFMRMEFWHHGGPLKGREHKSEPGEYYSVDGYELRDGLRAAFHHR